LFGAAMTKFEGFILLALVGSWMLLIPSAHPSFRWSARSWWVPGFCLLTALPFVVLRMRVPTLHPESGWVGYALHHPVVTLLNVPVIFAVMLTRLFLNPQFAHWRAEAGDLHWDGHWEGFSSLFNQPALGLPWLCFGLSVMLWFARPESRVVVVWISTMLIAALLAFSLVFSSFVNITSLEAVLGYTADDTAGRYLLPVLVAWFVTLMTAFFNEQASGEFRNAPLAELKGGYWFMAEAMLIVIIALLVMPKIESTASESAVQEAGGLGLGADSGHHSFEQGDVQQRMEHAIQLEKSGKFVEAMEEYRRAAADYPTNPVVLNDLAWSLAANPKSELRNGKEAIKLAGRAVEIDQEQQAVFIGTLGAAYAEGGQFRKAIEMARKARDVALLANEPEVATKNEELLRLYSAGKTVAAGR
jgi:hypothetical protein